jgi:2-polyprenyl-6-methoxyphenol hydroxylase-like FAD-dependent oxidoreductase
VDVDIYERDSAPEARRQGYRLHLDADGVGALRASLPSKLFDLFEATSMAPLRYTTLMDTDFSIRRRFVTDDYSKTEDHLKSGAAIHLNVNRATLRELLLLGLEDCVHFDKTLLRYDSQERDVEVFFDDRTSTRCDLLVGADGANSVVRSQRVPAATSMDSGARAIYGRLSVPAARAVLPAHALADVFTAASDSRKLILGVGPVIYPIRPDLAAASLAPDYALASQDDYVGCIVA